MSRLAWILAGGTLVGMASSPVLPEEFCVADATGLRNALDAVRGNGADDVIKLQQGSYVGQFTYAAEGDDSDRALTIEGGYTAGCGTPVRGPLSTTLDGGGRGVVLRVYAPGAATLSVANLSVQNGHQRASIWDDAVAGLYLETPRYLTPGRVILRDVQVRRNVGIGAMISSSSAAVADCVFSRNKTLPKTGALAASGLIIEADDVVVKHSRFSNNQSGGLRVGANQAIVSDSRFVANQGNGGLDLIAADARLIRNAFEGNRSGENGSGGVSLSSDRAVLQHNRFLHNQGGTGALRVLQSGDLKITDNLLQDNEGGGVYLMSHRATLTRNTIIGNRGGGIFAVTYDKVTLSGNRIAQNSSIEGDGAGAYLHSHSTVATNNIIAGNTTIKGSGAGLFVTGTVTKQVVLTNNTFTGNISTEGKGGGLGLGLNLDEDTGLLFNNLFWNNRASAGADLWLDNFGTGPNPDSALTLSHNAFDQTQSAGIDMLRPFPIPPDNLHRTDPLFVDPLRGDFHLQATSPVIDQGTDTAPKLPAVDFDRDPRHAGSQVDIGADEYTP